MFMLVEPRVTYLAVLLSIPNSVLVQAQSTVTLTVTPSPSPTSPSYTDPSTFQSSVLNSTNTYRYQHSSPAVTWNSSLANIAQTYSEKCHFAHSGTSGIGENLASGYPDITSSIDAWGNERSDYSWQSGSVTGFTEATGHFTQLVWEDTLSTGCGVTNCDGKGGVSGWYLVCEYWPQGNVLAPSSLPSPLPSSYARTQAEVAEVEKQPVLAFFIQNVQPQSRNGAPPSGWASTATASPTPTSSTASKSTAGGVGVTPASESGVGSAGVSLVRASQWRALLSVTTIGFLTSCFLAA